MRMVQQKYPLICFNFMVVFLLVGCQDHSSSSDRPTGTPPILTTTGRVMTLPEERAYRDGVAAGFEEQLLKK